MNFKNNLTEALNIRFPLVMAPMFLVTTAPMVKEAVSAGILGCFPSLNFRNEGELEGVLDDLNNFMAGRPGQQGNYGVNIIVQKANPWSQKHLAICLSKKVPVFITSLGNPEETIKGAHAYGGKVFCDVTNLIHAKKCADLGCDGFVAVGQGAGGHAGPYPVSMLIQALRKEFPNVPILAAGGIANGSTLFSAIAAGAAKYWAACCPAIQEFPPRKARPGRAEKSRPALPGKHEAHDGRARHQRQRRQVQCPAHRLRLQSSTQYKDQEID